MKSMQTLQKSWFVNQKHNKLLWDENMNLIKTSNYKLFYIVKLQISHSEYDGYGTDQLNYYYETYQITHISFLEEVRKRFLRYLYLNKFNA